MKKYYLSPTMKVTRVRQAQILCGSLTEAKTSQNESYEVVDETTTNDWFK